MEVGEFVRVSGKIDKINYIDNKLQICKCEKGSIFWLNDIDKHSFRLIDLIEEKDFVNGNQVVGINYISDTIDSVYTNKFLFEEDIEDVLTHQWIEVGIFLRKEKTNGNIFKSKKR